MCTVVSALIVAALSGVAITVVVSLVTVVVESTVVVVLSEALLQATITVATARIANNFFIVIIFTGILNPRKSKAFF
jgi:hypothetical protein